MKTVIYHKGCLDGYAAAWLMHLAYPDANFVAGVYQESPPDVTGQDVCLVDFSYRREVIEKMLQVARSVTVFDHHNTALVDLKGMPIDMYYCTTLNSGAEIVEKYLREVHSINLDNITSQLIAHIADRDLWKFSIEHTEQICEYLYSLPQKSFEEWDKYMTPSQAEYMEYVKIGNILIQARMKNARSIIAATQRDVIIDDITVPLVNCNSQFTSCIGNLLAKEFPYAATYFDTKEGRVFSLRSDPSQKNWRDVSNIAWAYGGGGHKHAAGFRVNREHHLATL